MSGRLREDLGITNVGWGVCGFTSTFYAMWDINPGLRAALIKAPRPFNVLAEIKQYLVILEAEGRTAELKSIRDFTRSFGPPYDQFKIKEYIERINRAVDKTAADITKEKLFGIAMPPDCVADYAKRIWQYNCTVHPGDIGGDGIIGVKSADYPNMTAYGGLCHWMYRHNNRIYSWGKSFGSVAATGYPYTVIWTLRFGTAAVRTGLRLSGHRGA
ncbi:hypothetical protein [Muricoccus radiodurans]|uniref:hypothetical protein n=1 Tax=Muricoccus radiodurans TaxID=2231721 RepID=UPI003CF718D7